MKNRTIFQRTLVSEPKEEKSRWLLCPFIVKMTFVMVIDPIEVWEVCETSRGSSQIPNLSRERELRHHPKLEYVIDPPISFWIRFTCVNLNKTYADFSNEFINKLSLTIDYGTSNKKKIQYDYIIPFACLKRENAANIIMKMIQIFAHHINLHKMRPFFPETDKYVVFTQSVKYYVYYVDIF